MEPTTIEFLITKAAKLTLFVLMLNMGLNLTIREVSYLRDKPGLLLRALLASFVLVPLVAVIVAQIFPLPVPVRIGIMLMAVTPGAPLIYQKVSKMKWNVPLAASYQVTVSFFVIVFLPFITVLFSYLYPNEGIITPLQVFKQVLSVQFIPLAIGLSFRAGIPDLADDLQEFVTRIGNGMFLALAVVILIKGLDAVLDAGIVPILAITLIVVASLGIGHFLGGHDLDTRATLAIANTTRNAGLALVISVLNFTKAEILPTVIVYALISAFAVVIYNRRLRSSLSEVSLDSANP
jgi:BASS family bile acid:Na+ symporter